MPGGLINFSRPLAEIHLATSSLRLSFWHWHCHCHSSVILTFVAVDDRRIRHVKWTFPHVWQHSSGPAPFLSFKLKSKCFSMKNRQQTSPFVVVVFQENDDSKNMFLLSEHRLWHCFFFERLSSLFLLYKKNSDIIFYCFEKMTMTKIVVDVYIV